MILHKNSINNQGVFLELLVAVNKLCNKISIVSKIKKIDALE